MTSLVVTVTVEGDTPRGEVQARSSLRNLEGVRRLQRLCERFGVTPTYLLTYPVVTSKEVGWFARAAEEQGAELGVHLQPWTTPPFDPHEARLQAVAPGSLGAAAVAGKIEALTEAFTAHLGAAPTVHRAACASLHGATLQTLERLHYAIDTTATPLLDARDVGGLDWREAPEVPWFPDRQRPRVRGASPVLEVPVSAGWDRELPEFVSRGLVRAPGVLRSLLGHPRVGAARLRPFDPVAVHRPDLCRMADVLVERGLPCLNLALRSPELVSGESARITNAELVERLFATLEDLFRYLVDQLRLRPRTLSGFGAWYLNETAMC